VAKYRKMTAILLGIIIVLIIAEQFSPVQRATARATASVYVALKYNAMDLAYQGVEYSPQFGDYFVSYRSKEGKQLAFAVKSRRMPFIVSFDPLKQEA